MLQRSSPFKLLPFPFFLRPFSSSKTKPDLQSAVSECRKSVQEKDHESFLSSIFYPNQRRPLAWAIRAFNNETLHAQLGLTNPESRALRFGFWGDAIQRLNGTGAVPSHPVLNVIDYYQQKGIKLSQTWFYKILKQREANHHGSTFRTMSDLETYVQNIYSSLVCLECEALSIKSHESDHIASHLGIASGIVDLLKHLPSTHGHRRWILPLDITVKHNIVQEDIYQRKNDNGLQDAVFDLAVVANDHLHEAKKLLKTLPKNQRLPFLSLVPTERYLQKLEQTNFRIEDIPQDRLLAFWLAGRYIKDSYFK